MVAMRAKFLRAKGKPSKPRLLREDTEMQAARARIFPMHPERLLQTVKPELPAEGTLRYMRRNDHLPPALRNFERK